MEWGFTPEQVVKGEVGYGLEAYRRDLAHEVRMNVGAAGDAVVRQAFDLIYGLCYWRATGRSLARFLEDFRHDPPATEFLQSVSEHMDPNVTMLGAILQRLIMDRVEAGESLERALQDVASHHARVAQAGDAERPPD
jgi:hypothetical protein